MVTLPEVVASTSVIATPPSLSSSSVSVTPPSVEVASVTVATSRSTAPLAPAPIPVAAVSDTAPVVVTSAKASLPVASSIAPAVAVSSTVPALFAVTAPSVRSPVSAISVTGEVASTSVATIAAVERTSMPPLAVSRLLSVSPPVSLMKMPPAPTVTAATRSPTSMSSGPVPPMPAPPDTPIAPCAFSVKVPVVVMSVTSSSVNSSIVLPPVRVRLMSVSAGATVPTTIAPAFAAPMTSVPAVTRSISAALTLNVPPPPPTPTVSFAAEGTRFTVPAPAFSALPPSSEISSAVTVSVPPPAAVTSDAPASLVVNVPAPVSSLSASTTMLPDAPVTVTSEPAASSVIPLSAVRLICPVSEVTGADSVNAYLKSFSISAKDIRGYHANDFMKAQLEDLIRRDRDYEAAKRRAMARLESGFDLGWTPPASREELHER